MKQESATPALTLAASSFAALGSEQRLLVLRTLVRAGSAGLSIGTLGERTGVTGSTLTHHLKLLASAGLVKQEKQGRSTICAAVGPVISPFTEILPSIWMPSVEVTPTM